MSTNNSNPNPPVSINALVGFLELYLVKKAPALPTGLKEFIVNFAPWYVVISFVIALPAVLLLFGLSTVAMPFSYMGGISRGSSFTLFSLLFFGAIVLELVGIPGLFKKSKFGWNMVFYATVLNGVSNLIDFNLTGLLIGTLLMFYVLFQVKEYYK